MSLPGAVQLATQEIIRRLYGEDARLAAVELPGAWQVARLHLSGSEAPSSVVVKWLRTDPRGWRTDPRQMATEVAGLRFAHRLAPGLVPELIAEEVDTATGGVVILEDLSPREPLDAIIRRDGVVATAAARLDCARAMGRLAAATVGREGDFLDELGPAAHAAGTSRLQLLGPPWDQHRQMLEAFGVRIPAAAEQEMAWLRDMFAQPGPFLALSNGDLAENNFMINTEDVRDHGRLIDFEFAHFDHALAHAASFFVPGPRWMVVDDPIADQLEQEFRATLAAGIPEAADDELYQTGIAAGCVAMGFERCGNLTVMDRRPPGHASRIQRIATVEAAAAAAEARGRWTALTDLLRDLALALRRRWPDADVAMSRFAPYTPRLQ